MQAPSADEPSVTPEPPKGSRTRLFVALGCLLGVFLCCCGSCGLFVVGSRRHVLDVQSFTPPPLTDPEAETDPSWRVIETARHALRSSECEPMATSIGTALATRSVAEVVLYHEWIRARLADADTQGIRDACQAVSNGGCAPARFVDFRSALLLMGRQAFERAIAEPDSLAATLAPSPFCNHVSWLALEVIRSHSAVDAGVDASVGDADGGPGADGGVAALVPPAPLPTGPETASAGEPPPIDTTTRTRARSRYDLPAQLPRLCARFTCGPGDVFEDGFR